MSPALSLSFPHILQSTPGPSPQLPVSKGSENLQRPDQLAESDTEDPDDDTVSTDSENMPRPGPLAAPGMEDPDETPMTTMPTRFRSSSKVLIRSRD